MKYRTKKFFSLLIAGLFTFHTTAFAQNKPSLIVTPLKGKTSKAAVDAIIKEFKASGQVYVVDFEKVMEYVGSKQQKKEKKSTKDAVAAFEKGKKSYQGLNIKEAIASFEKSKLLYQEALWNEESFQGLRTTKFHLAMAYLADQKTTQAKLEIQEMIQIDPNRAKTQPSEKYYSPQVRELYKKVLKEVQAADKGGLQIETTPAGSTVFMDGASIGKTPLDIRDIPLGRHYFRLVTARGDQEEFMEKFIVSGNNEIEFTFKKNVASDAYVNFQTVGDSKELEQSRATFLDEMGLALGADVFVFLTPGQGNVKGQLYDQRSQELSHEAVEASPQALVDELLLSLGPDGYVVPSDRAPKPKTAAPKTQEIKPSTGVELKARSDKAAAAAANPNQSDIDYSAPPTAPTINDGGNKAWYQKTWVWVLIGAGVVGGASALYLTDTIKFGKTNSTVRATIP